MDGVLRMLWSDMVVKKVNVRRSTRGKRAAVDDQMSKGLDRLSGKKMWPPEEITSEELTGGELELDIEDLVG